MSDADRKGHWILTYTMRKFWPLDPRQGDFFVEDIAHALANICRYGGHIQSYLSVAQHSVLAAEHVGSVDPRIRFEALMHDAAEAYPPGDILKPLKHCDDSRVRGMLSIQDEIEAQLKLQFGLAPMHPEEVSDIDMRLYVTEIRDLRRGAHPDERPDLNRYPPLERAIMSWSPAAAEARFLRMYERLTAEIGGAK